jgi:hypothetical protein
MNEEELRQFLFDSNQAGYGSGEEKRWIKELNGSTSISYKRDDWKSHDNFFGGEPYGGRIIVSYKNRPVWMMVYYGFIVPGIKPDLVYEILKKALLKMPKDAPFRGPKKFEDSGLSYLNEWIGDIENYSGEEKIFQGKKMIYKADYMGGLVDRQDI